MVSCDCFSGEVSDLLLAISLVITVEVVITSFSASGFGSMAIVDEMGVSSTDSSITERGKFSLVCVFFCVPGFSVGVQFTGSGVEIVFRDGFCIPSDLSHLS